MRDWCDWQNHSSDIGKMINEGGKDMRTFWALLKTQSRALLAALSTNSAPSE